MKKVAIFFYLSIICSLLSFAQQLPPCDQDSLYHKLDFWVGEWDVYDVDKKVLQGTNKIEKELNGCAITEYWEAATGGKGMSLFYVDNKDHLWKQVWVTTRGNQPMGQKEKTLVASTDKSLTFEGSYPYNAVMLFDRTVLTHLESGEVRQEIMVSSDGQNTWRTTFIGIYVRREQ